MVMVVTMIRCGHAWMFRSHKFTRCASPVTHPPYRLPSSSLTTFVVCLLHSLLLLSRDYLPDACRFVHNLLNMATQFDLSWVGWGWRGTGGCMHTCGCGVMVLILAGRASVCTARARASGCGLPVHSWINPFALFDSIVREERWHG